MLLFKILASLVLVGGMVIGGYSVFWETEVVRKDEMVRVFCGAVFGFGCAAIMVGIFALLWFALPA